MTENEAIEFATEQLDIFGGRMNEYLKMTIKALEEIQQYRAIGTVGECRVAVEKQDPKKPIYEGDGHAPDGTFVWDVWICPNCDSHYEVDYDDYAYCPNCGQALDLEENEE